MISVLGAGAWVCLWVLHVIFCSPFCCLSVVKPLTDTNDLCIYDCTTVTRWKIPEWYA